MATMTAASFTRTPPPPSSPLPSFEIWRLPDEVLYHVACYVSAPTHRAHVLVFQIALLNHTAASSLCNSPTLWDCVLHGDYHPTTDNSDMDDENHDEEHLSSHHPTIATASKNKKQSSPRKKRKITATSSSALSSHPQSSRRSSERLRRSPVERVRDVHQLMLDHTEIAYSFLWECCYAAAPSNHHHHRPSAASRRKPNHNHSGHLTKAKLVSILNEYGPCLRYHRVMSTGGTMLVEVCRAKHVPKATILQCVKELVFRAGPSSRDAMMDTSTQESASCHLTPLCVAAVRALPQVVRYLIEQGADCDTKCSGRFKCQAQQQQQPPVANVYRNKKSVQGRNVTALEFAKLMHTAEVEAGATARELTDLTECIRLLSQTTTTT